MKKISAGVTGRSGQATVNFGQATGQQAGMAPMDEYNSIRSERKTGRYTSVTGCLPVVARPSSHKAR
jgi:hypothetical protein